MTKAETALREIAKEVYTDGTPTKAARTAMAALAELPQSSRVSDLKTPPELLALIERSKNYVMSPEEIYEQRRSFARGMCPSNRDYKKWCETVDRMMPPLADTRPDRKCK